MTKNPRYIDGKDMWHNSPEFDEMVRTYLSTRDKSLLDKLTEAHRPLVVSIANHYVGYLKRDGSLELGDLIQEGSIGLMKSIDYFDPDREGRNFHAYATMSIRQAILRSLAEKNKTIRLPVSQIVKSERLRTETEIYVKQYGRKPTIEQLAKVFSMPTEEISEILQISDPISLDIKYSDGDENREARAIDTNSDRQIELISQRDHLKRLLDRATSLTLEERDLVNEKYGLDGYVGFMTNKELGRTHGITGERIRQKMIRIRRKIRNANARLITEESAES